MAAATPPTALIVRWAVRLSINRIVFVATPTAMIEVVLPAFRMKKPSMHRRPSGHKGEFGVRPTASPAPTSVQQAERGGRIPIEPFLCVSRLPICLKPSMSMR